MLLEKPLMPLAAVGSAAIGSLSKRKSGTSEIALLRYPAYSASGGWI